MPGPTDPTVTDLGFQDIIAWLTGRPLEIGLYVNPALFPTETNVLADLDEPTFLGYARQTLVWAPPVNAPPGVWDFYAAALTWTALNTTVSGNNVYGWFVLDTVTGHLWALGSVSGGPYDMNSIGKTIVLNPFSYLKTP